jgi:predicted  nucleic acid-binding Zn-ribbon protein
MHKCIRCGKPVSDLSQIEKGCGCGSKAFVFVRDARQQDEVDTRWIESEVANVSKNGKSVVLEVENIKMLEKGVFEIDLNSLMKNPLVFKDVNGVYYVKLPVANTPQFIFG